MIKLLVSDMDGTLFNSNQEITPFSLNAIKKAQEQGLRFMIATGRSIETIGPTLERYNLKCGLILLNGAEVRNEELNIISTIDISYDIIPRLAKVLEDMGYIPEYMTNQGSQICGTEEMMRKNMGWRMMCLDRTHTMTFEEALEKGKTSVFQKALTRNESLEEMFAKEVEIRKIIVFNPLSNTNGDNREALKKMFPELSILSSYPENIEINSEFAKKGTGLEKAIKKMGLTKDEVAVFGDGYNDLSLFELFPNSYAPENAEEGIKELAKEIIPSNNDDGVGKKILELLGE